MLYPTRMTRLPALVLLRIWFANCAAPLLIPQDAGHDELDFCGLTPETRFSLPNSMKQKHGRRYGSVVMVT